MSPEISTPTSATRQTTSGREQILRAVPWLWLALAAVWVAIIFATDQPAWPLTIWIATTLGPLAVLRSRLSGAEL